MNCGSCKALYNSVTRAPRLLVKCGHSVCGCCQITTFTKGCMICPECKQINYAEVYSDFPKNLALLNFNQQQKNTTNTSKTNLKPKLAKTSPGTHERNLTVEELTIKYPLIKKIEPNKASSEMCLKHSKKYEAFCENERVLICIDCILNDGHKNHDMVSIQTAYQKEVLTSKQNLEKSIETEYKINEGKLKAESKIIDLRKKLKTNLKKLKTVFKEIKKYINSRIVDLEDTIRKSFDDQIDITTIVLQEYSNHLGSIEVFKNYMKDFVESNEISILSEASCRDEFFEDIIKPVKQFQNKDPTIEISPHDECKRILTIFTPDFSKQKVKTKEKTVQNPNKQIKNISKTPTTTSSGINSQVTSTDKTTYAAAKRNPITSPSNNSMGYTTHTSTMAKKEAANFVSANPNLERNSTVNPENLMRVYANRGTSQRHSDRLVESRDLRKQNKKNNINKPNVDLNAKKMTESTPFPEDKLNVFYEPQHMRAVGNQENKFEINFLHSEKISQLSETATKFEAVETSKKESSQHTYSTNSVKDADTKTKKSEKAFNNTLPPKKNKTNLYSSSKNSLNSTDQKQNNFNTYSVKNKSNTGIGQVSPNSPSKDSTEPRTLYLDLTKNVTKPISKEMVVETQNQAEKNSRNEKIKTEVSYDNKVLNMESGFTSQMFEEGESYVVESHNTNFQTDLSISNIEKINSKLPFTDEIVNKYLEINDEFDQQKKFIYIIGGVCENTGESHIEKFDFVNKKWEILPVKSSICKAGIANSLDGNILLFGGKKDGARIADFIKYSVYDNTFSIHEKQKLKKAKSGFGYACFDDKIFVCGGNDGKNILYDFEEYNTFKNNCTTQKPLILARDEVGKFFFIKRQAYAKVETHIYTQLGVLVVHKRLASNAANDMI